MSQLGEEVLQLGDAISYAVNLLQVGELIAFPTETVYGLGAHALQENAVQKIFTLKGRPSSNPLIVHVADRDGLHEVADLSDSRIARQVEALSSFWPGPLSLVLPKQPQVPSLVTAGGDSVAVRIPNHPIALRLLKESGFPIAAPSANPSNYISPTTAEHVRKAFGDRSPYTIDGGACDVGIESTVLSLVHARPTILRPGAITKEQIAAVLRQDIGILAQTEEPQRKLSPGMMKSHYAPNTPLFLRDSTHPLPKKGNRIGYISFSKNEEVSETLDFSVVKVLSSDGNLDEIASHLFAALYEMDSLGLDYMIVDSCDKNGVGMAIMDRLQRAVYSNK